MMRTFDEKDLVRIAKRDNNTRRPYLFVNPLQGKHIPAKPSQCFELFSALGEILKKRFPNEKLLLIGFAETATAIGAALAVSLENVLYYIHTTREDVAGGYIQFSEVHSHAAEQRLVSDNLSEYINASQRIVFVEDEVTTGNTILNLINALRQRYGGLKFGVVSILNSMDAETLGRFRERGTDFLYLLKIDKSGVEETPCGFEFDKRLTIEPKFLEPAGNEFAVLGKMDPRIGLRPAEYMEACRKLVAECLSRVENLAGKDVLVLGSEEFMFPPMLLALEIEKRYNAAVRFHATTRSPILPGTGEDYPLNSRFALKSVYDGERNVFLYNLRKYDVVIWLFDAESPSEAGIHSLCGAVQNACGGRLYIFRWGD